jgi:hypothetical protein
MAMTNPMGRSFLCYRRSHTDDARGLILAQHEHGIPTWRDVDDLNEDRFREHIDDELRDPERIANAIIWVTSDMKESTFIKLTELPALIEREKRGDGFFLIPCLAQGLDHADIDNILGSDYYDIPLSLWTIRKASQEAAPSASGAVGNPHATHSTVASRLRAFLAVLARTAGLVRRTAGASSVADHLAAVLPSAGYAGGPSRLEPAFKTEIAERVLAHRLQAIEARLPPGEPLDVLLYTYNPPPAAANAALVFDWHHRFRHGQFASPEDWGELWHVLNKVGSRFIYRHCHGRRIKVEGKAAITALVILGAAFPVQRGIPVEFTQIVRQNEKQIWSLEGADEQSGFNAIVRLESSEHGDLAVLVSVARDVSPAFTKTRRATPDLRINTVVEVRSPAGARIENPSQARHVARLVAEKLDEARRSVRAGRCHFFMAVPVGLAMMIGQLCTRSGPIQFYEWDSETNLYKPSALLDPSKT